MGLKPTLNPFSGSLQVTLDPYLDDNYNTAGKTSPLVVSDDFSSANTTNQWAISHATVSSTMAFNAGTMVITRGSAGAYTSEWMNRNSVGRDIIVSVDAYSTTATACVAVRLTDADNMILVSLQTNGTFGINTVQAGVSTSRATATVPSYSSSEYHKITVKVYGNNVTAYVSNAAGAVQSTIHYCNAIVGAITGTLTGLGTGAAGTSVTYDNYKSRVMQTCTNIIALGDSNTIGQYIANRCPTESTFTNLLAKKYRDDDFMIFNGGVSSRQTTAINAALSTELYPYFTNRARNLVILLVGMGDFTIGGKTAADAWTDMQTLCANILNNGWELLVLTYFPKEDDATNNGKCRDFNAYIRAGADTYGYRVFDTWDMFVDKSNDLDADPQYYYPGSSIPTHINATGHFMIYDKLRKFIYPVPAEPLVLTEQLWPLKRVEICDHDKASLIRLYHDNSNAILSTSTGGLKFSGATDNYQFGLYGLLAMSSLATGNGISVADIKSLVYPAIGFRVIPSAASSGFNIYGENYMSMFSVFADTAGATRYVIGMPETAASGIVHISLDTPPRPFIWSFATTTSGKTEALRLSQNGLLKLTTTAPASNLTAGAENISLYISTNATKTWAAGAITTQRESVFLAPTYAFASASTITTAATLAVAGAPTAGSNATITNNYAFWVQDGTAKFDGNIQQGSRWLSLQGADVTAANDITLGNGNYFDVTGATEVQRILGTGWTAGSVVTLQFDSNPNVKHGTAAGSSYYGLQLAGAADFAATAGDTLMLVFDGAWWREVARTAI